LKQVDEDGNTVFKMFPILGGRLLKIEYEAEVIRGNKFPILGGRLLKVTL